MVFFLNSNPLKAALLLTFSLLTPLLGDESKDELTPTNTFAAHLLSHRYDLLFQALESDAPLLIRQIQDKEAPNLNDPEMRIRLLLHATLDRLPYAKISDPSWNSERLEFLQWLFTNPENLAMLLSELREEDNPEAVLSTWAQLFYIEVDELHQQKYAPLALAISLLYDRPNAVRKGAEEGEFPTLNFFQRYEYFKVASESGKLSTPASRLTVRELVKICDLNISKQEIDWVHKNVSGSAKKAGAQYDEIIYLMERATDGVNPYKTYTLSEIKKHGGICADQAHYSMNAAKARGIPAATVIGTGDRGPHAWIAFMPKRNSWSKHGSQGITNGKVYDTQRGKRVSSRLFYLESDEDYHPKKREPVLTRLHLAERAITLKAFPVAQSLIDETKKIGRHNFDIWQTEERLLVASQADPERWKSYFHSLERIYRDHSNVLEWSLKKKIHHLFAKLPEEERTKLLEREIRSVARELGSEENALITVVDRISGILAKQGQEDAIRSLYRKCFRRYGSDLELFSKLISSYVKNGSRLPNLKAEIPKELHKAYKRNAESNTKEYFRAKMEIDLMRRIIRVYRQFGTEEDADLIAKLEKETSRRLEKAKRAAN